MPARKSKPSSKTKSARRAPAPAPAGKDQERLVPRTYYLANTVHARINREAAQHQVNTSRSTSGGDAMRVAVNYWIDAGCPWPAGGVQ